MTLYFLNFVVVYPSKNLPTINHKTNHIVSSKDAKSFHQIEMK